MRKAACIAAFALALSAGEARAACYQLVAALDAVPNATTTSTNPNASVGLIEGFVDPLTGTTQSVTVIVTPSWAPCTSGAPGGKGRPFAWHALFAYSDKDADFTRGEVLNPQKINGSYPFVLPFKMPPPPGGADPAIGSTVKYVVVWYDEATARRVNNSF